MDIQHLGEQHMKNYTSKKDPIENWAREMVIQLLKRNSKWPINL